MSTRLIYILLILAVWITACGGSDNRERNATELSEENKKIVEDIMKEEPVVLEPQATFDQSQLNNKLLGLCVKFKTLNGANRKEVFEKLETVLPSCPTEYLDDNRANPNMNNAVQAMSFNDLKELLGEPNEVREDGVIVYNLMADRSYRVIFLPNDVGVICCRFYEGDS